MTPGAAADAAILVDAIAAAAVKLAELGDVEQARHLTRYAVSVLPVSERVARAWTEADWLFASARTSTDAIHAVRAVR